ncbi:MAG: hypothetical protein ACREV7_21735 [Steroidobacteraceae bacterium]
MTPTVCRCARGVRAERKAGASCQISNRQPAARRRPFGGRDPPPTLLECLYEDAARAAAVAALVRIDREPAVRHGVVDALLHRRALEPAMALIADDDPDVRRLATQAGSTRAQH